MLGYIGIFKKKYVRAPVNHLTVKVYEIDSIPFSYKSNRKKKNVYFDDYDEYTMHTVVNRRCIALVNTMYIIPISLTN